jgi:uncharacterized cupin superfamily protein
MTRQIINIENVELQSLPPGFAPTGAAADRYESRMGHIGPRPGAQKLGCNITSIPRGKHAFPFHNHRFNEETFFVLAGAGEIRIGDVSHPVRTGDIIACPPGGEETAHQFVNTGTVDLKYPAVSTRLSPDIAEYPNTGKFGVLAEYPSTAEGKPQGFRFVGRTASNVDYWEGE